MDRDPASPWTVRRTLSWMSADFTRLGIATARLDAELLVARALECDRVALYMDMERPLNTDELERIRKLVLRRRRREPVAYILGHREFYGRQFEVTPAVLIPRPETETLVERALEMVDTERCCRVLDLCTGSGAIAVTLAAERERLTADAVDISRDALQVALANARKHGVDERIRFHQGDLFSALPARAASRDTTEENSQAYELIVGNPPYIASGQWPELAPEIAGFEPEIALRAGVDGFDFYRRISAEAGYWLERGGSLLLEVGHGQADAVAEMLRASACFERVSFHVDLAGMRRVVAATAPDGLKMA